MARSPIPANAVQPTNALLTALDLALNLGGKLIERAMEEAPELNQTPVVNEAQKMESSRAQALKRALLKEKLDAVNKKAGPADE